MRFAAASLTVGALVIAATPVLAAPARPLRRVVLPAMPLGQALILLARRTGRDILFSAAEVAGKRAPAVDAANFDAALDQIVRRSGMTVERLAGGAIRLTRPPLRPARPPRAPPRRHLPTVDPGGADIVVQGLREGDGMIADGALRVGDSLTTADIRRLPDRTIAEALGRLPGVLTLATSLEGAMGRLDHAGRAIGDFAAVRGLPGSYFETRVDGIELPQSLPYSRGAQLGLMAASPGTTLRLRRVLGAAESGEAISGRLDIDHASPFSAAVHGLRLGATAGLDDRSRVLRQDAASFSGSVSIGGETRDGRFAAYLSGEIARRPFTNVEQTYQTGNLAYAVTTAAGTTPAGRDPAANLLLAGVNAQVTHGISRDADVHLGLGWRPDDRLSVTGSVTWAVRAVDQDVYQISAQGGRSADYFERTSLGGGLFQTRSVRSEAHYWFETNPERDQLGIAQIGIAWATAPVTLQARLFGAFGRTDRPDHIEISFWDPVATRLSRGVAATYQDGLPVLPRDPATAALLGNPRAFPIHNQGERESERSQDHRLGGEVQGRIDTGTGGTLSFGGLLLRSDRDRSTSHDIFSGTFAPGTTLGSTGLVQGEIGPIVPGIYDYIIPVISDPALRSALSKATIAAKSIDDIENNASSTREDKISAYATLTLPLGAAAKLDLGLRAQTVRLTGRFWLSGNDGVPAGGIAYGWNQIDARYSALLPSVALTWTAAPAVTIDASVWTGQTRPAPYQLTGGGSSSQDSQGTIVVQMPNAGLKAVRSLDLDLGVAWSPEPHLRVSIAGFAKRLTDYLYDAGNVLNNADTLSAEQTVLLEQPRNGGTATIAGVEAGIELPLRALAPRLRHVSIGSNATLLHSAVHLDNPGLDRVERTQYAPAANGRLWLRYDDGRVSADVSYRATSAYIQEYGLQVPILGSSATVSSSALDTWVRPSTQLDLGAAVTIAQSQLRLTVRNALNDVAYRSTIGRYSDAVPQTILGGRQIELRWERRF